MPEELPPVRWLSPGQVAHADLRRWMVWPHRYR
jgi:hypothetical protein